MNERIAKTISVIMNPYIHPVYLFIVLTIHGFIGLYECIIGILLYSVIPFSIHLLLMKLKLTDKDVKNIVAREALLFIAITLYVLSASILRGKASIIPAVYSLNGVLLAVLTPITRVSIHVASFTPAIAILSYAGLTHIALILFVLMIVTAIARITLRVHTLAQTVLAIISSLTASILAVIIVEQP